MTVPRFELRADNPRHIRALIALRDMYATDSPKDRETHKQLAALVREFDLCDEFLGRCTCRNGTCGRCQRDSA